MPESADLDREWLHQKYHVEGLTGTEIAEEAGCSRTTVYKYMREYNISRDRGSGYRVSDDEKYRNKEWLESKYHDERLSTSEIGELCDCHKQTIKHWLEKHNIEKRSKSEAAKIRAEKHPHTQLSQEDIEKGGNWWHEASEEEREEFRQWLSEQRKGENNPMAGKTGPDHHNWKEDKPNYRFYQTDAWKEIRQEALERANHECEVCTETEKLVGHHVIPLSDGGEPLDVDNVAILCRSCHMEWEGLYLRPDTR